MSKQNGSNLKKNKRHTWVRRFQYLFIQFHPKCWMLLTHSQVLATVVVSIGVDQPWESMSIFTAMSGYGLDDMDDVIYIYTWYIEYNRLYILVIWYYIYIIHMYVNIEQHDSFWLCFCHKEDLRRVAASMRRQQISIRGCMGCSSSELSG
jgi:hypothetical protein